MKTTCISILLFLIGNVALAQDNFVYIRFDNSQGNPSDIVRLVGKIVSESKDHFVVFCTNGDKPVVCETLDEWESLRDLLLTRQNTPDFYPEEDFQEINGLFTKHFNETVSVSPNLSIIGIVDSRWTCTFILPESILSNESVSDYYSRLIAVNQLFDRMAVNLYSYTEKGVVPAGNERLFKNSLFTYKTY